MYILLYKTKLNLILFHLCYILPENLLKPKPRRQRVQQPGLSSEDVAKWEGAPVTTHLARDDDDNLTRATEVANGMTPGQKVRAL